MEARNAAIISHNAESISIHIESSLEEQIDSDNHIDSSISSDIHTFIDRENITPPCEEYTTSNMNESLESTIQFSLNYEESTISIPNSPIMNCSNMETSVYYTPLVGSQIVALDDYFYTPKGQFTPKKHVLKSKMISITG